MATAARELVRAGLADPAAPTATLPVLLSLCTAPELRAALRSLGLPRGGRRAELELRLVEVGQDAAGLLRRPSLRLRHRALVRRVGRLFLHDHRGDLSRLVVARMGVVQYPTYVPTGGAGLFPNRRALRAYETHRVLRYAEHEQPEQLAEAALAAVEAQPRPAPHRWRFSGARYAQELAVTALRAAERVGDTAAAASGYQRLIATSPAPTVRSEAALRRALCLERLDRAPEAAALCAVEVDLAGPVDARRLARTGRRLARKAGTPWRPLPPLRKPRTRRLRLVSSDQPLGHRPAWWVGGARATVELAVQRTLAELGRTSVHTESGLWTTLFGLLFFDVLFADVPEMLPTPMLTGPLDLHDEGFFERRAHIARPILSALDAGEGPARLAAAIGEHVHAAITGVRWDLVEALDLPALAEALGPDALAGVMSVIAQAPAAARRGLPDLCVLPGPEVKLPEAVPARIGAGPLFVEVKGPTDSLREAQRLWLHRLLEQGVSVEVWAVQPAD